MATTESKALTSGEKIRKYLDIGKQAFQDFIRDGLPVRKCGRRWVGHKDEIDEWFRVQEKRVPYNKEGEKG